MTTKEREQKINDLIEKIRTTKGGRDQGGVNLMTVIRLRQIDQAVYDRIGTILLSASVPELSVGQAYGSNVEPVLLEWRNDSDLLTMTVMPDLTTQFWQRDLGVPYAESRTWRSSHDYGIPSGFIDGIMSMIERLSDD